MISENFSMLSPKERSVPPPSGLEDFSLCKHILEVILEARDESNTGVPFGCLLTQIILQ